MCCVEEVVHFDSGSLSILISTKMFKTDINRLSLINRKYILRHTSDFYGFIPWRDMRESLLDLFWLLCSPRKVLTSEKLKCNGELTEIQS